MTPARALGLVSLTAILANSTWFSATAVVPPLDQAWRLGGSGAAWLVPAVQLGFITGSVAAALLNLPDRLAPRRLIAGSALAAAMANAALLLAGGLAGALPLRFLVGVALAGVYAPGVRLVATYFERGRGLATAAVVGALTLGSAAPHLVRGAGDVDWHATILVTSALATLAALVVSGVPAGPGAPPVPPRRLGAATRALRRRPLRLATLGYMGHMWELYALWAWLPAFYVAARAGAAGRLEAGLIAFAAIGLAGMAGALAGGVGETSCSASRSRRWPPRRRSRARPRQGHRPLPGPPRGGGQARRQGARAPAPIGARPSGSRPCCPCASTGVRR